MTNRKIDPSAAPFITFADDADGRVSDGKSYGPDMEWLDLPPDERLAAFAKRCADNKPLFADGNVKPEFAADIMNYLSRAMSDMERAVSDDGARTVVLRTVCFAAGVRAVILGGVKLATVGDEAYSSGVISGLKATGNLEGVAPDEPCMCADCQAERMADASRNRLN